MIQYTIPAFACQVFLGRLTGQSNQLIERTIVPLWQSIDKVTEMCYDYWLGIIYTGGVLYHLERNSRLL